jgi:hypothetical protein
LLVSVCLIGLPLLKNPTGATVVGAEVVPTQVD